MRLIIGLCVAAETKVPRRPSLSAEDQATRTRPAARPYSREPGPQAPVQEPDCTIARRTRPLLRGEAAMVQTDSPPADCPNSVTEAGSPPKLRMLRALRPAIHRFGEDLCAKKKRGERDLHPLQRHDDVVLAVHAAVPPAAILRLELCQLILG